MEENWNLDEFDFPLEEELIARYPPMVRGTSRLLRVHCKTGSMQIENSFSEIQRYLKPGDILVLNNTRVSKRRVFLLTQSGRIHESIFLEDLGETWRVLLRNVSKLKKGEVLSDGSGNFQFELIRKDEAIFLRPSAKLTEDIFEKIGTIPIPPYLKRNAEPLDEVRYQTVYASVPGSVAAPTAGLHFTSELKEELSRKGILFMEVTLRVGYGTFAPLTVSQIEKKELHEESYYIPPDVAEVLNRNYKKNRIISVGTTTLRALESSWDTIHLRFREGHASTKKFIMPDDRIQTVDGLITNFHLPKSSLLLLVSALTGKKLLMDAYRKAIENRMKFFSYGDAMFLEVS